MESDFSKTREEMIKQNTLSDHFCYLKSIIHKEGTIKRILLTCRAETCILCDRTVSIENYYRIKACFRRLPRFLISTSSPHLIVQDKFRSTWWYIEI